MFVALLSSRGADAPLVTARPPSPPALIRRRPECYLGGDDGEGGAGRTPESHRAARFFPGNKLRNKPPVWKPKYYESKPRIVVPRQIEVQRKVQLEGGGINLAKPVT